MSRIATLADDVVRERLERDLPHWSLEDGTIRRTYRTHSWKGALMVANTIGHLAEAAWHHPDLTVSWGRVGVSLSTHEAKGVTERDFLLARKIEDVVTWQPGRDGGALEGTPDDPRHRYLKND
jgi:4a-hydroxytetrahydrobiopterin dehydratase